MTITTQAPVMYVPAMGAFINRWFAKYEDAKKSLETEGGYLFPFKDQFFVTEDEAIRDLGMDPRDPDWDRIGHDWVRPLDAEARQRLMEKRLLVQT